MSRLQHFELIEDLTFHAYLKRQQDLSIGLVPTMGYLHEGHASLIEHASAEHDLSLIHI